MAKYKDGEYISLYYEDRKCFEVVKGHISNEEFLKVLKPELDFMGTDTSEIKEIKHAYGRWGVGRDEMGETCQTFYDYSEKGRGRFPVTLGYYPKEVAA